MFTLDPSKTALVLIDLQKGILGMPLAPHSAEDLVSKAAPFARALKAAGATLFVVNVSGIMLPQPVDAPRAGGAPAADWDVLHPDIEALDADIRITKRQWGAFHGTELDLQLRRRGITDIVLGGIATNFGVEQTAREGWQHGYAVTIAEDITTSLSPEMHRFAIENLLVRIGRVRQTSEILAGIAAG